MPIVVLKTDAKHTSHMFRQKQIYTCFLSFLF